MTEQVEELISARLRLRPLGSKDLADLAALHSRPDGDAG